MQDKVELFEITHKFVKPVKFSPSKYLGYASTLSYTCIILYCTSVVY